MNGTIFEFRICNTREEKTPIVNEARWPRLRALALSVVFSLSLSLSLSLPLEERNRPAGE